MFLLNWGSENKKTVEGGVDRVVVYSQNLVFGTAFFGDVWDGVVNITHNAIDTVDTTFWDTRPVRQKHRAFGITGTVEAYTTPKAFHTKLAPGVVLGGQPIPITHLSYRTMISRATATTNPEYAITLIYGAMFRSAESRAQSFDQNPNAELKSWSFSAYPWVDLYQHTDPVHLTIKTGEAAPELVAELEHRLYGAPNAFAYMPSLAQVTDLVETYG